MEPTQQPKTFSQLLINGGGGMIPCGTTITPAGPRPGSGANDGCGLGGARGNALAKADKSRVEGASPGAKSTNGTNASRMPSKNANGTIVMTTQPSNESELQLYRVLQKANLLSYYDTFICQGGDDVEQLCEAGEDEFLEIMALVGMASKPLHVRRLQKVLQEWINSPNCFQSPIAASSSVALPYTPPISSTFPIRVSSSSSLPFSLINNTSFTMPNHRPFSPPISHLASSLTLFPASTSSPLLMRSSSYHPPLVTNSPLNFSSSAMNLFTSSSARPSPPVAVSAFNPAGSFSASGGSCPSSPALSSHRDSLQSPPVNLQFSTATTTTNSFSIERNVNEFGLNLTSGGAAVDHLLTQSDMGSPAGIGGGGGQIQLTPVLIEAQIQRLSEAAETLIRNLPPQLEPKNQNNKKKMCKELEFVMSMAEDDTRRMDEIRKYAAIYGRFDCKRNKEKPLTLHEVCVNEAAAQMCRLQPALLTRRDELFPLARQVVRNSGYQYSKGHSSSTVEQAGRLRSSSYPDCSIITNTTSSMGYAGISSVSTAPTTQHNRTNGHLQKRPEPTEGQRSRSPILLVPGSKRMKMAEEEAEQGQQPLYLDSQVAVAAAKLMYQQMVSAGGGAGQGLEQQNLLYYAASLASSSSNHRNKKQERLENITEELRTMANQADEVRTRMYSESRDGEEDDDVIVETDDEGEQEAHGAGRTGWGTAVVENGKMAHSPSANDRCRGDRAENSAKERFNGGSSKLSTKDNCSDSESNCCELSSSSHRNDGKNSTEMSNWNGGETREAGYAEEQDGHYEERCSRGAESVVSTMADFVANQHKLTISRMQLRSYNTERMAIKMSSCSAVRTSADSRPTSEDPG